MCRHAAQGFDALDFLFVQVMLEAVEQPVERHLGRIGYKREHGMGDVSVDGLQHLRGELLTQFLALAIDILVRSTREVDTFKRASAVAPLVEDAFYGHFAVAAHEQRTSRLQFLYVLILQVKRRLEHGALRGQDDDLVIAVIECGADAPGVAHGEHLSAARQATDHIATVKVGHGALQHILHLHMLVNIVGDGLVFQPLVLGLHEIALHLAVEAMAHGFHHDVAVAIDAGALALAGELPKDLINVGHVVVATETEVLGFPVVAAQEGMHIFQTALASGGIAQVAHVELTCEGHFLIIEVGVVATIFAGLHYLLAGRAHDFGDGIGTLGALAEHVLVAGLCVQFHRRHACAFLSTVVLLLHHEIEFVETVHPGAIFLLVVAQGLQQANHRHTTILVYILIHNILQ